MNKDEALNILIASACCHHPNGMCDKCPWCGTNECVVTKFSDVIEEAVDVILEETNENNEIIRYKN